MQNWRIHQDFHDKANAETFDMVPHIIKQVIGIGSWDHKDLEATKGQLLMWGLFSKLFASHGSLGCVYSNFV